MLDHKQYLTEALKEARKALAEDQNPIGCVIVDENGKIIARAHNRVAKNKDKTAHAEIRAIGKAKKHVKGENIRRWTLYTTLEPCIMCMGTILMADIGTVVWGAGDRLQQTHRILKSTPYLKLKRLVAVACPDPELEKECQGINDNYWVAKGRPEVIKPIPEGRI
jgi:tRNA(adenine34) deaminase